MNKIILILIILNCSFRLASSQKAFLLTTSVGFYNYRQLSNVLEVYHLLKKYGFQDQHILLSFPENVGCCQKNTLQGSISFRDNVYDNMNRQIEADYKYYEITSEKMGNVMTLKYKPSTLNFKRVKLNDQPYFMYLTGHGGDFYFKFRERQALVDQNFEDVFKDLSKRRPTMPIFIMADSCSAITPYEQIEDGNIIVLGSSSFDQKSLSMGHDKVLNCPKSDEFTFYLSDYINENNPLKTNITIAKLQTYIDVSTSKKNVHSKLISPLKRNKHKLLKEFMTRSLLMQQKEPELEVPASFFAFFKKQLRN